MDAFQKSGFCTPCYVDSFGVGQVRHFGWDGLRLCDCVHMLAHWHTNTVMANAVISGYEAGYRVTYKLKLWRTVLQPSSHWNYTPWPASTVEESSNLHQRQGWQHNPSALKTGNNTLIGGKQSLFDVRAFTETLFPSFSLHPYALCHPHTSKNASWPWPCADLSGRWIWMVYICCSRKEDQAEVNWAEPGWVWVGTVM